MRVILIVIDSLGIGGATDASLFNDEGSNTYNSILPYLHTPTLNKLGIQHIDNLIVPTKVPFSSVIGSFARLEEKSMGKDTIIGHWEIAGVVSKKPFPTYPNGFPKEIIEKLQKTWNKNIIGNYASSGTEIIKLLGDEHTKTLSPIVYTSADSVLQIACNTDVIPLEELYTMCEQAREIMQGEHRVGRIIARPFIKKNNEYVRTEFRKDYSVAIDKHNMLTALKSNGFNVYSYGKIFNIFNGEGITQDFGGHTNDEVLSMLNDTFHTTSNGLLFVNLVDTDMLYGHRNDIIGYANAVNKIDNFLSEFISKLHDDDYLIITGDHGCDPSTPSTDHSRENVPCLIYNKLTDKKNLGTINGFDYIADYVTNLFNVNYK